MATIKTKFEQTEIGMIPEDWEVGELQKLSERICVGYVGTCQRDYCDNKKGIPMIRTTNLSSQGVIMEDLKYVTPEFHQKNKKSQLKKGDVLIARHGEKGIASVYNLDKDANCLNIVIIRPNSEPLLSFFILYALKSPFVMNQILANQVGSVQGVLNTKVIAKLLLPIPKKEERTTIAKILSNLDSKIELNQQMNKTLESVAQALFKHWFIDFEFPNEKGKSYKSSGGEMVNSELGRIPKGWKVENIQDLLVFEKGVEPGSKYYLTENSEENIRFIRVGDISTPGRGQIFIPTDLSEEKICKEDDILLSLDATIGIVRIGMNGAFSSGVRRVYAKDKEVVPKGYIHSLLKSNSIQDTIYTYAIGTTILHAGASLEHIHLAVPNNEVFQKFSRIIQPIFNLMVNNIIQINNLSQIRDSLLPKLMSGKIRVEV